MPADLDFQSLSESFSLSSHILSDPQDQAFQSKLQRWSNINLQTPAAILVPQSEEDVQKTVQWAISARTPFVAKSGGMSLYSTIDKNGIVIDLTEFVGVIHDKDKHEATLLGGVDTKSVALELAKDGFCTTLPSANPVAAIPFFLNGGNSPLVSRLGYGSDNILAARLVTASGDLITVSESENSELLYAIRGAGQYFGLITSLTIRTHPVGDVFGNDEGRFWTGRFIFPLDRAQEVAETMESIVNDSTHWIGGQIMVAAPPPARKPAIAVIARLIGKDCSTLQERVFAPLYNLRPLASGGSLLKIENNGDALTPLCAPGGFKKLRLTGIHKYSPTLLPKIAHQWQALTTSQPDTASTIFSLQFESLPPKQPPQNSESANSMHNVRFWANNLTWCTDPSSQEAAQRALEEVIALTREGQEEGEYVDFANSVREPESPISYRYKGEERLARLRGLKRRWDGEGVFGREFL